MFAASLHGPPRIHPTSKLLHVCDTKGQSHVPLDFFLNMKFVCIALHKINCEFNMRSGWSVGYQGCFVTLSRTKQNKVTEVWWFLCENDKCCCRFDCKSLSSLWRWPLCCRPADAPAPARFHRINGFYFHYFLVAYQNVVWWAIIDFLIVWCGMKDLRKKLKKMLEISNLFLFAASYEWERTNNI